MLNWWKLFHLLWPSCRWFIRIYKINKCSKLINLCHVYRNWETAKLRHTFFYSMTCVSIIGVVLCSQRITPIIDTHVMRACAPTWSTCQRASVPAWFTCQRACVLVWFTGQRVGVLTCQKRANFSFLRANVSYRVPLFYLGVPIFQLGVPTFQKKCQFLKYFSNQMLRKISILCYYLKNSTFYLIS